MSGHRTTLFVWTVFSIGKIRRDDGSTIGKSKRQGATSEPFDAPALGD
jgi:hypothetical protein